MNIRQRNTVIHLLIMGLLISGCKPRPVQLVPISAGIGHACALTSEGGVKCWGSNEHGQLGDGTTTNRLTPVDVIGLTSGVQAIDAGGYFTCALTSNGGVKCWGDNRFGQLGDETTLERHTPVDVAGLKNRIKAIAAGGRHACALTPSGRVKCWGDSSTLGDGSSTMSATPVNVISLTSDIVAIAAGDSHTCALTSSGGAKCWGSNVFGELGNGITGWEVTPVDVIGLTSGIAAIAPGDYHTCALTTEGGVKCWGSNNFGELGDGTMSSIHDVPVDVMGLTSGVTAIATGGRHTCALTAGGGVKCWGSNEYGQLGDGTFINRSDFGTNTAVNVIGLTSEVVAIAAGDTHTCAVTLSGEIKCWGVNGSGQLGDGTTTPHPSPVDVMK